MIQRTKQRKEHNFPRAAKLRACNKPDRRTPPAGILRHQTESATRGWAGNTERIGDEEEGQGGGCFAAMAETPCLTGSGSSGGEGLSAGCGLGRQTTVATRDGIPVVSPGLLV